MKTYSTHRFAGWSQKQLTDFTKTVFRRALEGRSVQNADKGITVSFAPMSRKKAGTYKITKAKAAIIPDMLQVMEQAQFSNFGAAKPKHINSYKAVGILNFKFSCLIDGRRRNFPHPGNAHAAGEIPVRAGRVPIKKPGSRQAFTDGCTMEGAMAPAPETKLQNPCKTPTASGSLIFWQAARALAKAPT